MRVHSILINDPWFLYKYGYFPCLSDIVMENKRSFWDHHNVSEETLVA